MPPAAFLYRAAAMRIGVAREIKPREYRVALTPAGALELVQRTVVHAGLGVDDVGSGVEARAFHGSSRRHAFVDDAGHDSQERGPQACPSRSTCGDPRNRPVTFDSQGLSAACL